MSATNEKIIETAAALNQAAVETSLGNGAVEAASALGNQVGPVFAAAAPESAVQSIFSEARQFTAMYCSRLSMLVHTVATTGSSFGRKSISASATGAVASAELEGR